MPPQRWSKSRGPRLTRYVWFFLACAGAVACSGPAPAHPPAEDTAHCDTALPTGAVEIEGGQFTMGSDANYREESPSRTVTVDTFWMDRTEVTVERFARFVEETGYETVAERPVDPETMPDVDLEARPDLAPIFEPGGAVFRPGDVETLRNASWWHYVPGANWRHPQGPDAPEAAPREPVTQIAFEDAEAFASWAGGRLPTEAEWEYAALAADEGASSTSARPRNANTWQGIFPVENTGEDGFDGVAPAGCFAPNANGLHDMLGNVWEWTTDWYAPFPAADTDNPQGVPQDRSFDPANPGVPSRVLKGGSFLCAENYCQRYRPAARHPQETGLGTNHIGFRLVYDEAPED